jgi:mRNA interferase MazF
LKAVAIADSDFMTGRLHLQSFARPGKLFTANRQLMVGSVGTLKRESVDRIVDAVIALLKPARHG